MKLELREKNSRIVELYLDDEKICMVDKALFSRKLAALDVTSKEEFLERFLALEYKVALNLALRRLSMKSLHSQELAYILRTRLISDDTIKRVVSYFLDLGYLDDEAWLSYFVEKLIKQGKSAREIIAKGRARGIDTQDLLPFLKKVNNDSLKILVSKRYPVLLDKKSTFQQRQKARGALYRKGFSAEEIRSVFIETNTTFI